jgi:branched-chain amino acid transport system ATP-binding protein
MLAITHALVGDPHFLLLDEPLEGLAPAEIRGSPTLLLVDQNADLALAVGDRAVVINNGVIEDSGPGQSLRHDFGLRVKLLGV